MKKDTEELEHEIEKAKAVEHYLEENRHELRDMSLAVFLQGLLEEKQLKKADVIRRTGMESTYGYHIFDGHKKHPARSKVLLLALAMGLTVKEDSICCTMQALRHFTPATLLIVSSGMP